MKIVYLYCAFSYLFMLMFVIIEKEDPVIVKLGALLAAPITTPMLLGSIAGHYTNKS